MPILASEIQQWWAEKLKTLLSGFTNINVRVFTSFEQTVSSISNTLIVVVVTSDINFNRISIGTSTNYNCEIQVQFYVGYAGNAVTWSEIMSVIQSYVFAPTTVQQFEVDFASKVMGARINNLAIAENWNEDYRMRQAGIVITIQFITR